MQDGLFLLTNRRPKVITYEIRERVETTRGNRMETIDTYPEEASRTAMLNYFELVKDYPTKYFEAVKVETKETCLEFTKDR